MGNVYFQNEPFTTLLKPLVTISLTNNSSEFNKIYISLNIDKDSPMKHIANESNCRSQGFFYRNFSNLLQKNAPDKYSPAGPIYIGCQKSGPTKSIN